MRKEPFSVGSFVHIIKRGTKGTPIVRDNSDRWRFLKLLRYLNDAKAPRNWEREITNEHITKGFIRPEHWSSQRPYVSILAYCLMDNHFHLLVQEREEGGVSKFMQRLCTSMAAYHNAKYRDSGTLFQSAYRSRTVDNDEYLQYLAAYILVKNTFELFPTGSKEAMRNFSDAFDFAESYQFSSLPVFSRRAESTLLDMDTIDQLFTRGSSFLKSAREVMHGRYENPRLYELAMDL